jgi:anti-anti-sigma factor
VNRTTRAETPFKAIRRIVLEGEYDLTRKEEILALFGTLLPGKPVTIDLRRVTYADSTILAALVTLAQRSQGAVITLLGPQPQVRRILKFVSFDRLFRIVDGEL